MKANEYVKGTHFLESPQRNKSRYVNKARVRGTHSLEGAEAETSQNMETRQARERHSRSGERAGRQSGH
jgi:hypothetical protein